MSDSEEEEFFQATQLPGKNDSVVSDSAAIKLSVVEYFFIITFNWDLMIASPFEISVCESIKDFPQEWLKGPLNKKSRKQKIMISVLGGGSYSLFCKVEKGIIKLIYFIERKKCSLKQFLVGVSSKQRKETVRDLNNKYNSLIQSLSKQDLVYQEMVEKYPPRFLSGFTYEENPQPLRSQRISVLPIETDVIYIYV